MDVHEVARGFPMQFHYSNVAFLMSWLGEATIIVLALVPLEDILRGPSLDHEE